MEASDNRAANIVKLSRSTVIITVQRDSGPPRFLNSPYNVEVGIQQLLNTSIFTVFAVDPDLKGVMRYRLDGISPGTLYFGLNDVTGDIVVKLPLLLNMDVYAKYTVSFRHG